MSWYTIRSERFSADFGVNEWVGFSVFLRDGNDVYRTYFLQHRAMVQWIGSLWSLWSLTPYGGQSDEEDLPRGPVRVAYEAGLTGFGLARALEPIGTESLDDGLAWLCAGVVAV